MNAVASQITSLTIVYWTVYSGADQRKHQSSASLAFVMGIRRCPVNSPHKGPVTRKMISFHDVIISFLLVIFSRLPQPIIISKIFEINVILSDLCKIVYIYIYICSPLTMHGRNYFKETSFRRVQFPMRLHWFRGRVTKAPLVNISVMAYSRCIVKGIRRWQRLPCGMHMPVC